MTVSGLGGDDWPPARPDWPGRVLLTLNGNAGLDTLTGGDGADRVSGGEAADVARRRRGRRRVTGDRGGDQMRGGAGDDVLEWNDGDGSDVATGGDGADLTRVNGSVTRAMRSRSPRTEPGIRFQRTNLVPFTIDLDTERIEMNGQVGNDTIAVKPGWPAASEWWRTAVRATIASRLATARPTRSRAEAARTAPSSTWRTSTADVEKVDRPARSRAKIARKVEGRRARQQHRGDAPGQLPGGRRVACTGVLRLSTAKVVRVAGVKVRVDLGNRRFRVAPGETAKVKVKLPAAAKRLAKHGKLGVRAVAASKEGGSVKESGRSLTLKIPRG